jgi:type II secretion system protein G
MRTHQTQGFTLIELMIVVAIIGILAAIAIPNFLQSQIRAKVSRVHSDMRTIGQALELYAVDHTEYPYFYLCRWETNQVPPVPEYGSWEQNRWELASLTTPVDYLRSIPPDAFSYPAGYYPYDYVSFRAFAKVNFTMGRSRDLTMWLLRSRGPDRIYEAHSVYDPTNGAVSRGDISRSRIELEGGSNN